MADVRHQRKEGSAVSDRMQYVSKPIAVRSENLVTSIKSSNGSLFNGDGSTQVIFDIPAMSGGYYLDSAATRLSFNLVMQSIGASTKTAISVSKYLFLDRGPQSLINRFQLYDASGHLLEDIQNYHVLYGLVKVCTGNRAVAEKRNNFFKECRNIDGDKLAVVGSAIEGTAITATTRNVDAAFGGAVYRQHATGTGTQYEFINDSFEGTVADNTGTNIPLTLTFFSSVFGGGQDKYFPLSAMNGFRLVLTLNTASNAFQIDESSTASVVAYSINDPTIFTNMIRVDPAVDRGIIDASRGTDGRIRIHSQSWRTYTVAVQKADTVRNIIVPISVSSLKALYFTHIPATTDGFVSASSGYKRYTQNYQLFVGSVAIPTTPVQIQALGNVAGKGTFSEVTAELLRAWHIRLNDQDMGTLLQTGQVWDEYTATKNSRSNFFMGVELESFSNKDDTIESGANVLNNNVELRINYKATDATNTYNLVFFALHDIFIVIDPETGITTVEF